MEGATVAYIDTGNCFSPDRLNEIFCTLNSLQNNSEIDTEIATVGSPEEFFVRVLAKICCFKSFDCFSLLKTLEMFFVKLQQKVRFLFLFFVFVLLFYFSHFNHFIIIIIIIIIINIYTILLIF